MGRRWAVRGVPVVWALDPVFMHSEGSTTRCWWGVLSLGRSDVNVNNVFDVMDIPFIPCLGLIAPVLVVKGSMFDMRLCKGASAEEDGNDC